MESNNMKQEDFFYEQVGKELNQLLEAIRPYMGLSDFKHVEEVYGYVKNKADFEDQFSNKLCCQEINSSITKLSKLSSRNNSRIDKFFSSGLKEAQITFYNTLYIKKIIYALAKLRNTLSK